MCAESAQITASQRSVMACNEMTLAPVPLKTKHTSACVAEVPAQNFGSRSRVGVGAVAADVTAIGDLERGQHLGVHAGVVVAGKPAGRRVVAAGHARRCSWRQPDPFTVD